MKTVITYGTFDLLHVGHIRLLKRARALGDRLVVGLSSDAFNARKGKAAVYGYQARQEILLALRFVDEVIPEHDWQQKRTDILEWGAQVFVMGDDWAGRFDDLADITEVIYLPRTNAISTTDIKTFIKTEPTKMPTSSSGTRPSPPLAAQRLR